jgi:PPOX class probable F420-dependent enzyme
MQMSRPEMDAFLEQRHTAVVATRRRDESAQLTTVWYRWDGDAIWISTNRNRAKYLNMRRDPRVTVLIDDPPRETSVAMYGRAEFEAIDDAAYDGALAIVRRYVDDPEAYLAAREGEPRVLIRIVPHEIVTWQLGPG